jgi:uncharacterized protein YeaO (DUF488 family)
MAATQFIIKRVYEKASKKDGYRVLVDRLWPRGLTKEDAHVDAWIKDLAPSPSLRKWFGHDPERWKQFSREYLKELDQSKLASSLVHELTQYKKVTLLYAAQDTAHTHALVLLQFIRELLQDE